MDVFLVGYLHKNGGGVERYISNLLTYLPEFNINVYLIGYHDNKNEINRNIAAKNIINITNDPDNRWKYILNLILKTPLIVRRYKINSKRDIILHFHRSEDVFPFILFSKNTPKVLTLHGKLPINVVMKHNKIVYKAYEIVEKFVFKKLINQNSIIYAVDKDTKKFYVSRYPELSDKIMVIPTGVDTTLFKPLDKIIVRKKYGLDTDFKVIAYVGRLEKEKNVECIINAFSIIKDKLKNTKLIIVGDGREKTNLLQLIENKHLKLNHDVYLLGSVEHKKIPEILSCADVLVLCSLYEGSPTIIKESLACGTPVVSTNVGDVSYFVNSTNGRISSNNIHSLVESIVDVLSIANCVKIKRKVRKISLKKVDIIHTIKKIVQKVYAPLCS